MRLEESRELEVVWRGILSGADHVVLLFRAFSFSAPLLGLLALPALRIFSHSPDYCQEFLSRLLMFTRNWLRQVGQCSWDLGILSYSAAGLEGSR